MTPNEPLVIEKVANGWQVRARGALICMLDVMVFQDMGYAAGDGVRPTETTLLGFIEKHFRSEP